MKTSGIRSSIVSKFGCTKPDIEQRGRVIVITMPMHCVAQTKRQVQELAAQFHPIKIQGKNVVIRGESWEIAQCLDNITALPKEPEESDEFEETKVIKLKKPRFYNRANATA